MNIQIPTDNYKVAPMASLYRADGFFGALVFVSVISFPSVDLRILRSIFTHETRWFVLLALCVYLAARQQLFKGVRGWVGILLVLDCLWILLSASWSVVPLLSAMKGVAFVAVAVAFISAGYCWAMSTSEQAALSIFRPLTALALFAGLFGTADSLSYLDTGSDVLYRGLAFNPNYLGLLILLGLPAALWDSYLQRHNGNPLRKALSIAIVVCLFIMLLASRSRASFGAAAIMGFAFLYVSGWRKYAYFAIILAAACFVFFQSFQHSIYTYIYKGEGGDLLYTRVEAWDRSLEAAQAGGLEGVGYGASAGDTSFTGGFSAINYGREKGNTALAIAEELGAIGVALYTFLLAAIISTLYRYYTQAPNAQIRVALGLIMGAILGLVFQSQFEAWWDAPGSAGVSFFWTLVGVGLGVGNKYCFRASVRTAMVLQPSESPAVL